jgi:hypothetical protein
MKPEKNIVEGAQDDSNLYGGSKFPQSGASRVTAAKDVSVSGWNELVPAEMDHNMKADLRLIRMRNSLDPKRFYKAPEKLRTIFHMGTVIEGPGEYKSSRIERKGRHSSIVDEALHDRELQNYSKRKYLKIQMERSCKTKAYKSVKSGKRVWRNKSAKLRNLF